MEDGEELWGRCNAPKREIVICKAVQKHGLAREILLHELIHRYLWFLDEEVVSFVAGEIDHALDVAESEGILEL